jgi:hypothetical protein
MPREKIALEFEGAIPMIKELAGYDCRICLIISRHGPDEDHYILRTKKDERIKDGRMVDYCDILEGEMVICLPDHNYAHADHDWAERITYAEMLEARLPKDEYERLNVAVWAARSEIV